MKPLIGFRSMLWLGLCALLAACAPSQQVRNDRPDTPSTRPLPALAGPGEYLVRRGDTLYGIAFRHGMDYRELADRNHIAAPFTIYPGQRLQVTVSPRGTNRMASSGDDRAPASAPASTGRPEAPATGVVAAVAGRPIPPAAKANPQTSHSATGLAPISGSADSTHVATTSPPPAAAGSSPAATTAPGDHPPTSAVAATPPPKETSSPIATAALPLGPVRWQWPCEGQIVGRFLAGDAARKGINIAGNAGQSVRAAAAGVVVYSGSGLIGYGELIIVKHSETLLSAYGHNRKRLVAEGVGVAAGQQIAEMGRSGASRDMLHFEIRRNGQPVDPLPLLPKR